MLKQKLQTLILESSGNVVKRIDDYLYNPLYDVIIIKGIKYRIYRKYDEIDIDGWLVRKLYIKIYK